MKNWNSFVFLLRRASHRWLWWVTTGAVLWCGTWHSSILREWGIAFQRESLTKWFKSVMNVGLVWCLLCTEMLIFLPMLIILFWHAGPWRLSTHPFFLWIQKQIQWRSSWPCQSLITRSISRSLWVIINIELC